MISLVTRAHHDAVVAAKDETIALLKAQLERVPVVPPATTVAPAPQKPAPPEPHAFGKATELAILEQAAGNKQLEAHLRAVAEGLRLQDVEDVQIARTIRRCETAPRTIAQVVSEAAGAGDPDDVDGLV